MNAFTQLRTKIHAPHSVAQFDLIVGLLHSYRTPRRSGIIDTCAQSGYTHAETLHMLNRMELSGLIEHVVDHESMSVNIRPRADLQEVRS